MKNLKRVLVCGLLVLATVALVACGKTGTTNNGTENGKENGAEATAMKGADLQAIEDDKDQKEQYLVIDVRSEEEYKAGHVKFAINIFVDELEDRLGEIEGWKDKNVVVYCNTGKKSADAAKILMEAGFKNVFDAEGVKVYEYNLVTFGNCRYDELIKLVEEGAVVVDMRSADDYAAAHFSTAINGSASDLEALKPLLPEDKDTLIVTHCYAGNSSAVAAQYLIDLGYTNVINCMDGAKEVEYDFSK